jgi:hypothetical protein
VCGHEKPQIRRKGGHLPDARISIHRESKHHSPERARQKTTNIRLNTVSKSITQVVTTAPQTWHDRSSPFWECPLQMQESVSKRIETSQYRALPMTFTLSRMSVGMAPHTFSQHALSNSSTESYTRASTSKRSSSWHYSSLRWAHLYVGLRLTL